MSVLSTPNLEEIQRIVQETLKGVMPGQIPAFAKGVVEAPGKGWCRADYYDALSGEKFSFYEVPAVVAMALMREGPSRFVTAPTIQVPTVNMPELPSIKIPTVKLPAFLSIALPTITLPAAPTIEVPSITLPALPKITIPKPVIPYLTENFPGFYTDFSPLQPVVDSLNSQRNMLYKIQGELPTDAESVGSGINGAIYWANKGLKATYETVEAVIKQISDFRDNAQVALNTYGGTIKGSIDSGLADMKSKTEVAFSQLITNIRGSITAVMRDYSGKVQEAFNSYRENIEASVQAGLADFRAKSQATFDTYISNIQSSVNAGLSQFIPVLYDMMGLPPPESTASEEDRKALREMGDVNGDGVIDQEDMDLFEAAIGTVRGQSGYNEACDLNHDGIVDLRDLTRASGNFGKKIVPTAQLLSPAQLRNITKDGFEFWGLSQGMKLSYVAIGRR